jgi:hypothetical protein
LIGHAAFCDVMIERGSPCVARERVIVTRERRFSVMGAEARRTVEQALPERVGNYDAILQIGAGGMARAYLAAQRALPGQKPHS